MMVGKIARCADPGVTYRYMVIESGEINAFMDSRQNAVCLTSGLMNAMDDKELAFVVAHEVSHNVLGHYGKKVIASHVTTGAMLVADAIVPGLGYLNYIINPIVTNAFSREFELDADGKAAEIVLNCMDISVEDSMAALLRTKTLSRNSSTFILFASHPPFDDRVQNLAKSFSIKTDPNEILLKKEDPILIQEQQHVSLTIAPVKGKNVVLTEKVNIYEMPDMNKNILYTTNVNVGGTLTGDYVSGWWKIIIPGKCEGWVENDHILMQ